jgi:hypothetical protein
MNMLLGKKITCCGLIRLLITHTTLCLFLRSVHGIFLCPCRHEKLLAKTHVGALMHFLVCHLWYDEASLKAFGIDSKKVLFILNAIYSVTSSGNGPEKVNCSWKQLAVLCSAAKLDCFGAALFGKRKYRW